MPTYQLRANTDHVTEQGVCIYSATQAVPVAKVLTEAVLTFTDATGYVIGETITEATSTTTATVWTQTATTLGVIDTSDVFVGAKAITGGTSGTVATPTSVLNLLEKTAATPAATIGTAVIQAAQNLTASFVNVGGKVAVTHETYARFWVTLDINNSQDTRFKLLGDHDAGGAGSVYDPNKWTVRNSSLSAVGDYRELNTDADGLYVIEVETDKAMGYLQLQVQAGTVGVTPGQIDACYVTTGGC